MDRYLHIFEAQALKYALIGICLAALFGFAAIKLYHKVPVYLASKTSDKVIEIVSQPMEEFLLTHSFDTELSKKQHQKIQTLLPPSDHIYNQPQLPIN